LMSWAMWRCCWVPALVLALFQGFPGTDGSAAEKTRSETGSSCENESEMSRTAKLLRGHPDWAPPRKKESKVYQWAFDVQDNLLAVYACAVHLKVVHQGHLYLSDDHLSFQGVTIGGIYSVQFRIPLEDIEQILTGDRRGCAILQMRRPVELKSSVKSKWMSKNTELLTELEVADCEEGLNVLATICSKRLLGVPEHFDDDECLQADEQSPEDERSPEDCISRSSESLACKAMSDLECEETPFSVLLEAHLPRLKLKELAADLLADSWVEGSFMIDYLTKVGLYDFSTKPWVDAGPGPVMMREMTCIAKVPPAPMCPKTTSVTGTFIVCATPDLLEGDTPSSGASTLIVLSSKASHDVPFGNKFLVQEKVEITSADGGVDLKIYGRLIFLRSCGMFTGKIRSSAISELKKATELYLDHLRTRVAAPAAASPGRSPCASASALAAAPMQAGISEASTDFLSTCDLEDATWLADDVSTRTERVWELQRRTTVFQSDWKAPFLPHDGRKRWRWVDMNFELHALRRTIGQEVSAHSSGPPLDTPAGWVQSGDWQHECNQETDDEGWQYAIDFYKSDAKWGIGMMGRSVRRRLWTCRFVEAPMEDTTESESKREGPATPCSQRTKASSHVTISPPSMGAFFPSEAIVF